MATSYTDNSKKTEHKIEQQLILYYPWSLNVNTVCSNLGNLFQQQFLTKINVTVFLLSRLRQQALSSKLRPYQKAMIHFIIGGGGISK